MRDMRRVDVAQAPAADIDNFSIRQHARRTVGHIGHGYATANHAVGKLRMRRCREPFVHRAAFVGFEVTEGQPAQSIAAMTLATASDTSGNIFLRPQ